MPRCYGCSQENCGRLVPACDCWCHGKEEKQMALKDHGVANHADTMMAMIGETIVGVVADDHGQWWLIVKSGHALVQGKTGAYWREDPRAVKALIEKRRAQLKAQSDEIRRITAISDALP